MVLKELRLEVINYHLNVDPQFLDDLVCCKKRTVMSETNQCPAQKKEACVYN
jgi:ATP sulfurylase